jgi:sodium transport system ATP-binding protein
VPENGRKEKNIMEKAHSIEKEQSMEKRRSIEKEQSMEKGQSMEEILRVEGLKKTFKLSSKQQKIEKTNEKVKVAVDHLSFTAYRGEVFGLLGPNGAGKTTTLRMLATLIKPDEGDAVLDGASIVKNPEEVRGKIGFLTSELKLEEFFTPNYLFDFFADLHGVPEEEKNARRKEMFERFGIDRFAEVKVGNLSTGMKQKVSLVISMVHNPDIIIFDEPTNGLDVLTAKVVTDFLVDLKKQGKTVIVSTHIFSLIEKICDRVGIIINGRMEVCDTLKGITGDKSLEDRFFEIYEEKAGKIA